MESALARGAMVASTGERRAMSQTAKFEETLRRLAMIDEGFVEDEAGLGIDPAAISVLDPKTTALLQVGASVAIGLPAVCLEWSTGRARVAGASQDEIADTLLAVAPVAGLGRVVSAAADVATALGFDVAAALENQTATEGPPAGPAVAGEKGMATCDQRVDNWTVVLRRQPARIVQGRPEGGYTDMFELICCDCGDDPDLDYREVSPRLQLVRGPYPIAIGIAAYEQHVELHQ
jgi:alkylhydroperoxidase/carboxymuconolactone decarboxylase family protein YurZ